MVLTHAERARLVIRFLMQQTKKSQAELAQELGYGNPTVLSQILNGKKKMPKDLPARIAALDPSINVDFLTGSSDDMLATAPEGPETPRFSTQSSRPGKSSIEKVNGSEIGGIFVPAELVQMVSDLSSTIKDQQKMITLLVEAWVKSKGVQG
ncbi:MAG: helix-turn-helix transcriptional regulator [Bacteroidales bacterium]|nr:helix-turn-helix transcriptional regulator [Bacteroidales bacterium]